MKSVILLSGGLDSTYCAWKTLISSDEELTLAFLDLSKAPDNALEGFTFAAASDKSTNAVLKYRAQKIHRWLSDNVRPCSLLLIDFDQIQLVSGEASSPSLCALPTLIGRVNDGIFDKIISGHEKENDGYAMNSSARTDAGRCKEKFEASATRGTLSFMLLETKYTQATALSEMPQALVDLTYSCDAPRNHVPCGTCFKCSKRKFFCERLDTPPDILYDGYVSQCSVGGKWWTMKHWLGVYVKTYDRPVDRGLRRIPTWPSSVVKGE